ncbi:hypothetical protein HYX19_00970 [Candidatus Woesearchaeota archaeon]|nr:hypothetical protein [Candidatus Woesearchaeota archaeon]
MPKDDLMHVGIIDPNVKRKQILENAILIIQLLKGFEKIKDIRKEKDKVKSEFKSKLKEINKLAKEFNFLIPKVKLPEIDVKKELHEKVAETKEKLPLKRIKTEKHARSANLDKLDKDIDFLRKKLESL